MIERNEFRQAADADNPVIINYDLTRGGVARQLVIQHNEIINAHPRGKLLRNATRLKPQILGNTVQNVGDGTLAIDQENAPNVSPATTAPAPPLRTRPDIW